MSAGGVRIGGEYYMGYQLKKIEGTLLLKSYFIG